MPIIVKNKIANIDITVPSNISIGLSFKNFNIINIISAANSLISKEEIILESNWVLYETGINFDTKKSLPSLDNAVIAVPLGATNIETTIKIITKIFSLFIYIIYTIL